VHTGTRAQFRRCKSVLEVLAVTVHLQDVGVMGERVEQSATEAFGAEHLGPFGKRQRLEVLRGPEVVQPGGAKFTALCPGRCPDRL
jgi:hypothetical protein